MLLPCATRVIIRRRSSSLYCGLLGSYNGSIAYIDVLLFVIAPISEPKASRSALYKSSCVKSILSVVFFWYVTASSSLYTPLIIILFEVVARISKS